MLRPAFFCALAFAAAPAFAQTGNFELELNTSADVDGACRLTFVATNNTGKSLTKADYEVAVFDGSGAVSQILVLEFGELPLSKTRVVQFDLPQTKCEDLSRILVNTADACESTGGPLDVCMKDLSASSRLASIPFGL